MCATDADARFDARLEHLHQPASYPLGPEMVETRETHMSWVFLAGGLAYKLKKPIRSDLYDWRTAERRRRDCEREVALNRRLASSVYHGVVPLTLSPAGTLQLEGDDEPVDWLVKMRRLPDTLMLDWLIEHQCIAPDQIRPAIRMLCRLYRKSTSTGISGPGYCAHLAQSLKQSFGELVRPQYGQPDKLVRRVHKSLLSYIEREAALLRRRADSGRVIDAHGDLRPEHICLTSPPVIIDCLQFSDRLRVLDTASEIAFLMLECERLGACELNREIREVYEDLCEDAPPAHLQLFYQGGHACLRAMIAAWHLDDDVPDRDKWVRKAHNYLQMADEAIRAGDIASI